MKKIFKNLLLIASAIGLNLPITCCHSTDNTKTIEILSTVDDLTVMEEEIQLTKPIEAKCYDSTKQEVTMNIQFALESVDNQQLPNWIFMTDKNEIQLTGGKQQGSYVFKIIAFNEEAKIYSQPKTFKINVIPERHIIPDSISVDIENDRYCMYGEQTSLPIKIIPVKEGIEEKYLIKSCNFDIEVLEGQDTDLNGNKLFNISDSSIDPNLIISEATDNTYIGDYKLKISACLKDQPDIQTSIEITLHIDNIYYQLDDNNFVYKRESVDDDWTLALAPAGSKSVWKLKDFIQNKPVTAVTSNFCVKSQIVKLVQIILPSSITTIGDEAFANQTYCCLCEMPGVKYVGEKAFYNDRTMEYDPNKQYPSLHVVGNSAFEGCKSLNLDNFHNATWIGDFAFKNAGLSEFWCSHNCTYLGQEAFSGCESLENFYIFAQNPPILGGATFSKCDKLAKIYVPTDYLDDYKASEYWIEYQSKIEGI